jgi:Tfp pilus assembly protein PilW
LTSRLRRALGALRNERGTSLIELLTVCLILGVVLSALIVAFVSASTSELDQNRRFQAQLNARLALDKVRREVHCASSLTTTADGSSHIYMITETMPSSCNSGSMVSWCAISYATNRYRLYRKVASTCDATGTLSADYLTTNNIFTYTAQSTAALAKLHVDFPVNIKSTTCPAIDCYELIDDVYLRNSARS